MAHGSLLCPTKSAGCEGTGKLVANWRTKTKYRLNTGCFICCRENISNQIRKYYICIGYELKTEYNCSTWCCINCYGKLLHRRNLHRTVFDHNCYPLYTQFATDRFNGHNNCKLNEYRSDYQINLKLLTTRYIADYFAKYKCCNDIFNLIMSFLNTHITKITELTQTGCLLLNKQRNIASNGSSNFNFVLSHSDVIIERNNIYSADVKINQLYKGYQHNGFYIGIIPNNYRFVTSTSVTNIGNCYVCGRHDNYFHNSNLLWVSYSDVIRQNDIIKCVIDMKCGLICFIRCNTKSVASKVIAFKINKHIKYRFIVASCHAGDSYQLL